MATIEDIVRSLNREVAPELERRLREDLAGRDRDWLVDQLVRLSVDSDTRRDIDQRAVVAAKTGERADRLVRVGALALDRAKLAAFLEEHAAASRESLVGSGHVVADAPPKGSTLLTPAHRSDAGEALLTLAKDVLFALLFGDESNGTRLERVQQELLTMAVPRSKLAPIDFMQASTQMSAAGTWLDPRGVANDERADNVLIEVQFGEIAEELVGRGVVTALSLINNLEVNEQVLFARMINVEETNLIV